MRKCFFILSIVISAAVCRGETITITDFKYAPAIVLNKCAVYGDVSAMDDATNPLKLPVNEKSLDFSDLPPTLADGYDALCIMTADFENRQFTEAEIKVGGGIEKYAMCIDGKEAQAGKMKLTPGTHHMTFKYVTNGYEALEPEITIETPADGVIRMVDDGRRMFTLDDVLYGKRISSASISPAGDFALIYYRDTSNGGASQYLLRLYDIKSGKFVADIPGSARWMPKSNRYMVERNDYQLGRHLVAVNPATGEQSLLASHLPEGHFVMSPYEDFLIFSLVREGKKEDPEIYRVIDPEDRQPGWRDRSYPAIYQFDNQILQPLAMAKGDLVTVDISDDGSKLLLMSTLHRMTERPTLLYDLISLDLNTGNADTIVAADGFIAEACFSPDASKILVKGSPEALNRVGCTLPESVIPSAYDYQLFMISADDKSVTPLTRDFNPSINSSIWSRYDGKIYFTATDRDMYNLYVLDPKTGKIDQVQLPENVVAGFDCSLSSPLAIVWGQSDSNPDGIYTFNTKTGKVSEIDHQSESRLADVKLGECIDWSFKNPAGETVYARYYLPDNFDPAKKYPLIVNYYGGCTPSTRSFESRYPMHVYSSLGYVTLVIQPSGATGFGQEWSARHVSTAGKGVAEDIISGTEQFCKEMHFINPDKIGCIGASYGGFMTQYLQTLTDMFAAAVSHAGISDHTSYWGEGYWGYSYSEVSMGDDLPWTNPDLYVKQSPLYNADKIHTPILFLHGDVDTNVPVGESIQMFTALRRLGVDTELVQVSGQNHHITDDSQRKKWQNTIFAWFAKYLQDDPTWWNELYPEQNL